MPRISKEKSKSLTEKELNDGLNFFDYYEFERGYNHINNNYHYYTPDLINSNLKNINMNPSFVKAEEIEEALKNPKSNEQMLRNISTALEIQNMYYKRLLDSNAEMLSYNLSWDCINIKNESEYNSKEFKEDLNIFEDILNKFDYKEEFIKCHRQILRQGAIAINLRDDRENWFLQELPIDYTKIIGRDEYGLLYSFNFGWFIQNYGVNFNMYKPIFKRMFNNIFKKMGKKYDPTKNYSTFIYWENCNRKNGFWYFKPTPEITTLVPYYAPLFPDIALQPLIRKLQQNKNIISATKNVIGLLASQNQKKGGQVVNQMAYDSKTLGMLMGKFREGLVQEIGAALIPAEDIKLVDFNVPDKNISVEHMQTIANQSSASSSPLLDNQKLNLFQSKIALDIDANFNKSFYRQFENFMNYMINNNTKKYKFKIKFNDIETHEDKNYRLELFTKSAQLGIVRWDILARAYNENIFDFTRKMQYNKTLKLEKYLIPLMSLMNSSNNEENSKENSNNEKDNVKNNEKQNNILEKQVKKRGRPSKPNSNSEDTMRSNERGSNEMK